MTISLESRRGDEEDRKFSSKLKLSKYFRSIYFIDFCRCFNDVSQDKRSVNQMLKTSTLKADSSKRKFVGRAINERH
jgi:hypothetical protein